MHLVCAFTDLENLLVAIETRDRELVGVAVAAVDLERGVDGAVRELTGIELGHCRLEGERSPLIFQPRRLQNEAAGCGYLGRHVRQLELDRLEGRDRLTELVPLAGVGVCEVVGPLGQAESHGCDRDPPAIQDL